MFSGSKEADQRWGTRSCRHVYIALLDARTLNRALLDQGPTARPNPINKNPALITLDFATLKISTNQSSHVT